MALTDARPAAGPGDAGATAIRTTTRRDLPGLAGWLSTGSSARIGSAYVVTSLLLVVASAVAGELVGIERGDTADLQVLGQDVVAQVASFHAVSAVFLFVLPLFVGIATAVVPLQVGATTVAFPRAAAAAFWGWLLGSGLLVAGYLANGGPGGGDTNAVELFVLALGMVTVSLLLGAVCVATTVLTLRTPGLSLARVPMFSWTMLVSAVLWLLALPVFVANLAVTWLDLHYGQAFLGGPAGVGRPIAWAFTTPTVWLYAVPALGVVGEVVPVFSRFAQRRRNVAMAAIAVVGALGFGAYAQPFSAVDTADQVELSELSFVLLLPLLALVGAWADTARRGRPRPAVPLVLGGAALLLLLAGAAADALTAIDALELRGTTWEFGTLHLVLMGGAGLAAVGALHYWLPKLWGRLLSPALGAVEALLLLVGTLLLAAADLVSGALDQPAGQVVGEVRDGVEALNLVSAAGGALVVLAVAVLLVDVAVRVGRRRGPLAGDDPWEGHTLEWATTSPPPPGNFADVPEVGSATPVLDRRTAAPVTPEVA
ncbi:MAG TPA: cbb3-type cytochrome c oxidase subunit I [Acidimicrobiales bacterium]|jgi:heme/copper-type cytochrome/quinol oxidase subunit 1